MVRRLAPPTGELGSGTGQLTAEVASASGFRNGSWVADHRRLRFDAVLEAASHRRH